MNLSSESPEPRQAAFTAALFAPRHARRLFAGTEATLASFSPGERLLLYTLSVILAGSALALVVGLNNAVSVLVPSRGGSLTEGIVGSPRFANPLLAVSEPDKSVSYLVYSGLMRAENGSFIPDLAASYQISEDGRTYTFTIRDNAVFHDGEPVEAEDIVFTVEAAQNPDIKSPRRADWEGVTVVASGARTVVFKLPNPYAPFLENTTLGILPKHLWESVPAAEFAFSKFNTNPVGSGPYQVTSARTDETGAATYYRFKSFGDFSLGAPHIKTLTLRFYPNEAALLEDFADGKIDAFSATTPSRDLAVDDAVILRPPLSRVFGVFFNQNRQSVFTDSAVREALEAAVDKEALIENALAGYGVVLNGPVPPGVLGEHAPQTAEAGAKEAEVEEVEQSGTVRAREILAEDGWTFAEEKNRWEKDGTTLSFTLATADTPELAASAEHVAADWRAAGVDVTVHVYPLAELNTTIIRPRAYDALLFGKIVGRTPDLFAFWHSSQRSDPGLNLALYTNTNADALLSEARAEVDLDERRELYREFEEIVAADRPAVFLYAPQFLFVTPENLSGTRLGTLSSPAERYFSVHEWYLQTERVWPIFANE